MGHMTNFAEMNYEDKIEALENEIDDYEYYLSQTSNPIKHRNHSRYLKSLRNDLKELKLTPCQQK